MKLESHIRPISYLKAHAAEIVRSLGESGAPMVITQNGHAKAVLQDVHSYEQTQETLALLKILALGQQQVADGKVMGLDEAFDRARGKRRNAA
ncbi:MAG: type II toxin-antitoxin system Phd/YefM family antitoxin [Polycyclovorans sp.]|jgi:prevent-host-death family protein|nr:antitoxin, Phd family protein [Polycyclovorans sp.]MBU0791959.1 type II toxin-antitoxin system Phd/YefM family antitoxin [Gammaproteobacteria bacterium]MDP1541788.1 type II toxin-antitoxin system Phd/YefM family antitoxin [Polycyclovorans sp.]MEC8848782.1 type II toxin-antitoxin system Phd/YefM family antitoxin [Pseudomonadota bacterium]|tara:strand:+ start:10778 stop:11056 length:279 start_codon:yes stop_codon:yes gene_type:complete